jgi:hypothetical protein
MVRLFVKLGADWTACVQFRHPQEVGGIMFSFSMFLMALGGIILAALYDQEECKGVWSNEVVWAVMGSSCFCLFMSVIALYCSMDQRFLHTFTSLKCARDYIQTNFKEADDELKFDVFHCNVYLWLPEIGEDVKAFLTNNLPRLLHESPEWFDSDVKSSIPDELVEDKDILAKIRGKEVQRIIKKRRRKSSVFLGAAPAVAVIAPNLASNPESVFLGAAPDVAVIAPNLASNPETTTD